jgi:tRNA pseudouridine55 synthase
VVHTKPSGVLVVDKPRGPTSHDVVARLRRTLATREVGHAGTLDPMATGVLVTLVGEATKLASYLTAEDKEYEATIELGTETDTLDAQGKVTRRSEVPEETRAALHAARPPRAGVHHAAASGLDHAPADSEARRPPETCHPPILDLAIASEQARKEQIPPSFSAIHEGGERAYERARRGDALTLVPRPVAVRCLEVVEGGLEPRPWLTVRTTAGKGYFVRALARDLAAALGTVGHLVALRRMRSGSFSLEEAVPWDGAPDDMVAHLIPLAVAAARAMSVSTLSEVGARDARVGRPISPVDIDPRGQGLSAWVDARGELVAVGEVDEDGVGRVVRGFRSATP